MFLKTKSENIVSFFKVRGVASKQLVKSDVSTVPAEFVSYQQVVCPLPELDIHKPDQLANFNLKDNTDHSRQVALIIWRGCCCKIEGYVTSNDRKGKHDH